MNELGNYLKSLRKEKSLSIRKASEGIGISHTYLDSLEKGYDPRTKKKRIPTPEVLGKIANFYNVSFYKLMNLSDQLQGKPSVTEDHLEIIDKIFDDGEVLVITKLMLDVTLRGRRFATTIGKELSYSQSMNLVSLMNSFAKILYEKGTDLDQEEMQKLIYAMESIVKEGE